MKIDVLRRQYLDALRAQNAAWRELATEIPNMKSAKAVAVLGTAWATRYETFTAARAEYVSAFDAYRAAAPQGSS